jgi:hypothetical protein
MVLLEFDSDHWQCWLIRCVTLPWHGTLRLTGSSVGLRLENRCWLESQYVLQEENDGMSGLQYAADNMVARCENVTMLFCRCVVDIIVVLDGTQLQRG